MTPSRAERQRRAALRAAARTRILEALEAAGEQRPWRMPREGKQAVAASLKAAGASCGQIGDLLRVSDETVRLWLRDGAAAEKADAA